jgi:predicted ATPase
LVDELYNHRVRLVCSAADTPDRLFLHTDGNEEAILSFMDLESLQSETAVEGISDTPSNIK